MLKIILLAFIFFIFLMIISKKITILTGYLLTVLALFSSFFFLVIYLQGYNGMTARQKLDNSRYGIENIKAKRGEIITSDNHKLAFDIDKYRIIIDPTNIPEDRVEKVIQILSSTLEYSEKDLREEIYKKRADNKKYLDLKIEITYDKEKELKENLKKLKIINSWIFFEQFSKRYVSSDNAFESIIGFLNKENEPVYGIEKSYDEYLKGKDGKAKIYRSAIAALKKYTLPSLIDYEIIETPMSGNNVHLTIDSVMQFELNTVLKNTFEKFDAESVMGVIIETQTGKVIAMDSYPKAKEKSEIKNRVITDLFEPGSIFKPITVSSAIEEKHITKNTIISSEGSIKVKNRIIHDHDKTTVGSLPVSKIIAHSGNVAMVKIGQMMSTDVFYEYLKAYGLGKKTNVDTVYETAGRLFELKDFSEVRKSNVSFGQGISMNQLQMIMALNTTINGGKLLKPYMVSHITDSENNIVFENKAVVEKNVISEKTSEQIRDMLEEVVTQGTGRQVTIDGYRIGGKTGTAQKAGPRGYERGKYFSSFFAFIPADKPQYSILITVNEPKGAYYGASVALPSVKIVLERLIKYKGMMPTVDIQKPDMPIQNELSNKKVPKDLQYVKKQFEIGYMPDLTGLSIKSLLSIYPYSEYPNLKITGTGIIKSQNVAVGAKINKDVKIVLECK